MTVKIRAHVAVLASMMALTAARAADAHPELSALGTNRYVTAAVFEGRLDVTDALLEGALVSGDERRRLDADGDGHITDAELRAGEARLGAEGPAVSVEIDGRVVTGPVAVAVELGDDTSADAGPVVIERRLSLAGAWTADARRLRLRVTREPPKLIETELGVVVGPGYSLARGEDRVTFSGPRLSALEERAATFEIAGPPPVASRRARSAMAAGAGLVLVGFVVALAARRRRSARS